MEPLAQSICDNLLILDITIGERMHKIGLYADDAIISLTDPINSLPELHHTLDFFSRASLYKINYSKSSMLGIGLDQHIKNDIAAHTSFSWPPNSILTYLGIQLIWSRPPPDYCFFNFNNLVSKLQKVVLDPQQTQTSWAGKIALAKMYLLPHVLYMFWTILIPFIQKAATETPIHCNHFYLEPKTLPSQTQHFLHTCFFWRNGCTRHSSVPQSNNSWPSQALVEPHTTYHLAPDRKSSISFSTQADSQCPPTTTPRDSHIPQYHQRYHKSLESHSSTH